MARLEYFAALLFLFLCCSAPIIILCIVGGIICYFGKIAIYNLGNGTPAQNLARMKKEYIEHSKYVSWAKLCHGGGIAMGATPPMPPDYEMKPEEISRMEVVLGTMRYVRNI